MNSETHKKYLDADLETDEELEIAHYYALHQDDSDMARIILAEYPETFYDIGECDFDEIMSKCKRNIGYKWALSIAMCSVVAVVLCLNIFRRDATIGGLELVSTLEEIAQLQNKEVERITAEPKNKDILVTAILNDGSENCYKITKKKGTSIILISTIN